MRLRTLLAAAAAAASMLAAAPAPASANLMWCAGDPPQRLTSASGQQFVVNTQVYASGPQLQLHQYVAVSSWSVPDGGGGTEVTVVVSGPPGQYMTVVAAYNAGRGQIYTQRSGTGRVVVELDVPVA